MSKSRVKQVYTSEALREAVQKKAFELYQKRGAVSGNEWQDWFDAENEVKRELKFAHK